MEQFHNMVFEQTGDEVVAAVEPDAKENGHFSKSPHAFPFSIIEAISCKCPQHLKLAMTEYT